VQSKSLQFIRLSADRVVLKRGINEMMLSGPGVQSIVEPLVEMLGNGRSREEIVAAFPADLQEEVQGLLAKLLRRRLISEGPDSAPDHGAGPNAVQEAFWWNFGDMGLQAPQRLREARVVVVGANLVTRSLVRSLLEVQVGRVTLVDHPILDNHLVPLDDALLRAAGPGRLEREESLPAEEALADAALICAASDFGQPDALIEINRVALRTGIPFLPVWLSEMVGFVGPLNHPYETACLSCLRLRTDSNNPDFEAARAVRTHMTTHSDARHGAGLIPPMTGVVGEIAAMEAAKHVGRFTYNDTVARVIEINLISFAAAVRRVLKIPRCPVCSEMMRQPTRSLTVGPQLPREN
jgi:bacteriocin biosynthesis cyclodehydratase domain-containing protein